MTFHMLFFPVLMAFIIMIFIGLLLKFGEDNPNESCFVSWMVGLMVIVSIINLWSLYIVVVR